MNVIDIYIASINLHEYNIHKPRNDKVATVPKS